MAESTKDSLLCSVCLETFKEPKVLPCCHTFCKECLTKLPVIKKSQSRIISEEKVLTYDSVVIQPQCRAVNLEQGSASAVLPQDQAEIPPLASRKSGSRHTYEEPSISMEKECVSAEPFVARHVEVSESYSKLSAVEVDYTGEQNAVNQTARSTSDSVDRMSPDVIEMPGTSAESTPYQADGSVCVEPKIASTSAKECVSAEPFVARHVEVSKCYSKLSAVEVGYKTEQNAVNQTARSISDISVPNIFEEPDTSVESTPYQAEGSICVVPEIAYKSACNVMDSYDSELCENSVGDMSVVSVPCHDVLASTVGYIACPQCRREHKLIGQNGVDRFLTDYVIEAQIREQNISSNKTTCDECESTERVVSFCNDCTEYLCDFCTKAHERQKRFAGHNVTNVVLNVGVKRGTPIRKRTSLVCPQHHGEIIQLFCQQCETVVCNKCIVSVHSAHKLSEIDSKTRQRIDKQLASLSTRMERELTLQAENLKYVNKVEKMTNDMVTDLQQKINKRFDAYSAALERRRKELLSDCESKSTAKMKTLWSQRDSLETVIADMTATQNFTKRVQKCEDNGEFLLLTSQVLPRLKKLESWKWNDEVVENLELYSVDFQESNVEISQISRAGTIKETQLPCYTIDCQGFIENVTLGKMHRFTILVYSGKGCRSLSGIEKPSVSLRHVRSQTCDVATVRITRAERKFSKQDSQSLNTYDWTVTYTPYCGGRHKLTIQFDNTTTERYITVLGKPEIGSRVMRGPDGHGAIDGRVIKQRSSTPNPNKVKVRMNYQVQWAAGNPQDIVTKKFLWETDGRYEVQLFH